MATQTGIKQKLRTAQEKQQNIQVAEREWERESKIEHRFNSCQGESSSSSSAEIAAATQVAASEEGCKQQWKQWQAAGSGSGSSGRQHPN